MNELKLPPMPENVAYQESVLRDYANLAIEPYQKRIEELESQLEAVGAGGVTRGQRLLEAAPKFGVEKMTSKTDDIKYPVMDGFPSYLSRSEVRDLIDEAIFTDRQQRGEPVARVNAEGFIVEIGLDLAPGTNLYVDPQPAEPVQHSHDHDHIRDAAQMIGSHGESHGS